MNPIESISVVPTTPRQSMPSRFDVALQNAANHLARTVVGGMELAAPAVPGGTFLLGAVRAATQPPGGTASMTGASPYGPTALAVATGAAPGAGSAAAVAATGGQAAGGSDTDALSAARSLQAESQAFNAQYLQLQEAMQRENREFTALSNVMKVKHDTARAAIGNIQ
jgi:hypothetical protein